MLLHRSHKYSRDHQHRQDEASIPLIPEISDDKLQLESQKGVGVRQDSEDSSSDEVIEYKKVP
jgi:hypothetical protein